MADKLLQDYSKYPDMAHWFSPCLLLKLLNNVIVSSMFGQYADRRLIMAALDSVSPETHFDRATAFAFDEDKDGAVWIDWIADLGDGFDSTYAMALLLAQKTLKFGDRELPRGQMLIMGGDEVYPTASRQAYANQLHQPYKWAFPDHDKTSDKGVPVFAIPGNHDWYDGLVLFLSYFCREKHLHMGSWRTQQRRSYFAVRVTKDWWIWATDIQLADNIDQPQYDYFSAIAHQMEPNSKIILCGAEPGWLYTHTNSQSWKVMEFAIRIANEADRGLTFPLLLSGDTHHYSRYSAEDGKQFITSGGGGAFRHPTHHLADEVIVNWQKEDKKLSLTTSADEPHRETGTAACYPSKETSQSLLWQDLWFAIKNWDFSIFMGAIYGLMGVIVALRDQWDAYGLIGLTFAGTLVGYTYKQEQSAHPKVILSSLAHALLQSVAVILSARFFAHYNDTHFNFGSEWYSGWLWLFTLLLEMGVVGFVVGSTLFGLNMLLTCAFLRMNYNDAFSAFRLNRYNNFLRLRIKGDSIEVFAIGLESVPKRDDWTANQQAAAGNSDQPVFLPDKPLRPHLIEKVVVRA